VTAFHPLQTLDGPGLPLKVEQPSFGKTARTDEDRLYNTETSVQADDRGRGQRAEQSGAHHVPRRRELKKPRRFSRC